MQRKKSIKIFVTIFIFVILIVSGVLFYIWNVNYNKKNLIHKYIVDNTKEVYILGSIGKKHFNKCYGYSMEDLLSAMHNINPDIVLLTAREDHLRNFGIVDGDIDTCVAYSYCLEHNMPVNFINWWIIDNIYPDFATTNLQDDNIFIRISRNMREVAPGTKVLVITNSENFHEQTARFYIAGYKKEKLSNVKNYFKNDNEEFTYPPLASKIWKDRTYFYAFVFPRLVKEREGLFDSVKLKYMNADHNKFYTDQVKFCKYLNSNTLYK